ncbi:MAG: type II secretion system F family protein [Nitrospiraceae bacterium]|nr:type II secretion system F family protein [Nitrospiraceae bacterium]
MPVYAYEASDRAGRKVRATMEAPDEPSIKEALRDRGLIPISISIKESRRPFTLKRVTRKDLLNFTVELGNLLDAGLPIDRALYVLSQNAGNEELGDILKEVYVDIQKGQSLSQALGRHRLFPSIYVNMVRAGEAGGILEQVIKRLADFLETTVAFRDEIVSALIYPCLLVFVGGAAVAVLVLYVIPKFSVIFADMGQSLPLSTRILLNVSSFMIDYWWAGAACTAAAAAMIISYSKTAEGRALLDTAKMKLPFLSSFNMKFAVARFSRTLGTLLQSGVPVLESVRISREVLGNQVMSQRLLPLEEGIRKGKGMAGPIKDTGVFPPMVGEMISVGEEAGKLEDTFLLIAERYEAESRSSLKKVISLLEPALILFMGVLVGFIVVSMLMAVFSINDIPL